MPKDFSDKLASFWVARTPLGTAQHAFAGPRPLRRAEYLLRSISWPIAVVLILQFFLCRVPEVSITDDFGTVYAALQRFLRGDVVYDEIYYFVNPHYLYNPGATLLLSPIGLIGSASAARLAFIVINGVAIVVALALLTRMFGWSLRGAVFPTAVAAAFATESVRSTLTFGNVNGLLLLALVLFYVCLLQGRQWWGGLVIGLAILIKPIFAPLLVLSLALWHWRTPLLAAIVVVAFNLASVPFFTAPRRYFTELMPYLRQVRDYANGSINGTAVFYHMPAWVHAFWWLVIAAAVVVALLGLARWRNTDRLLWVTTSGSVLFIGEFLLSSLGQQYYSILLFPTIFTILLSRSVLHAWPVILSTVLFLAPVDWKNEWNEGLSRLAFQLVGPASWSLFLVGAASVVAVWWWLDRSAQPAREPAPAAESDAAALA